MTQEISFFWFRRDLRVQDNPGLLAACQKGAVLPLYILDEKTPGAYKMGEASRWWLHHSLENLARDLDGALNFYEGDPLEVFKDLSARHDVRHIFWNRCYEPWRIQQDTALKTTLKEDGVMVESFQASLLWEPWHIKTKEGNPYKVFTPYYQKGCLQAPAPRAPLPAPQTPQFLKDNKSVSLASLHLRAKNGWDEKLESHWHIGEKAAHARLHHFLEDDLSHYKEGRDFPALGHTSRLSPHLAFGEISPHQIWHALGGLSAFEAASPSMASFASELGWREFSYYLLYHFPSLPHANFQPKFDTFPWRVDDGALACWQQGKTGYPLVDAGMRELWQTGTMHNRVRMVVASFLVKNLRLDWRLGAAWFWDCLTDADLASNSASWQWVAGSGADAAPYFRIFNPVTQGQKFDPDGTYIRRFVPEIAALPDRYLFAPWTAPDAVRRGAHVILGQTYPAPLVDLPKSRDEALRAYQMIKEISSQGSPVL